MPESARETPDRTLLKHIMKHTLKATFLAAAAFAAALPNEARADFVMVGTATDNRITTDTRWTRDNVYILGRVIFVANGAKLTIEPGTIIRGLRDVESDIAEEPGTLVAARGGKIIANGTVDAPIIFTSIDDPNVPGGAATVPATVTNLMGRVINVASLPNNNYSPGGPTGNNGFSKGSGSWGGIIISGRGHVSANTGNTDLDGDGIWDGHADSLTENFRKIQNAGVGTDYPEGLSSGSGSNVLNGDLAIYGGTDDEDDSGILRYVVNRYGGFVIGAAAVGNEINGITLCGMGAGTAFEHCEVYQNKDDGIEWFGGKHDTRFLFSNANQDDSFDADEGYRGNHQFWTAIQGTINVTGGSLRSGHTGSNGLIGHTETASDYQYDKLLEVDGGEPDNGDRLPLTDFRVYNATLLSGGTKFEGLQIRLEARVGVHNAIVENASNVSRAAETGGGIYTSMLTWSNLYAFRATPTAGVELPASSTVNVGSQTATVGGVVIPILTQVNPMQTPGASQIRTPWRFSAISNPVVPCPLYTKNGLDPRLDPAQPAYNVPISNDPLVALPAGFVNAPFAGSMRDNNHMFGWTSLHALEVFPVGANLDRPVITLGVAGGHPTISFEAEDAGFYYVVEKSTNGKKWTVLTTNPLTGTAGTVTHTDTTSAASDTVLYRVYGL